MHLRPLALPAMSIVAAASLVLGACSSTTTPKADGGLSVATSFYPIEFAAAQLAGDHATVMSLTKPGAEPHDMELSAKQVADLRSDDLLVYARGFQPALDEVTGLLEPTRVLDVAPAANLTLSSTGGEDSHASTDAPNTTRDPHFWLDPQRYAAVAKTIGARLAAADPAHAADYEANTTAFVAKLHALDAEFRDRLATCRIHDLVTSHAAFGYLAERYGFTQHGITGISPGVEPSAGSLAAISELVRRDGITTIYQETLVEPHLAQVVASETGARIATLDPLEGITSQSAGSDYFEVMRANLAALEKGQHC